MFIDFTAVTELDILQHSDTFLNNISNSVTDVKSLSVICIIPSKILNPGAYKLL